MKYLSLFCLSALLITTNSFSQSRSEKLEAKIRSEFESLTRKQTAPLIKAFELQKIINDTNLILIDVRENKEQQVSMLPHALSTLEFAQKFKHGIPAGSKIVTYCTIGYRSGKYAEELRKQQIIAYNLEGGVLAWSFLANTGGLFVTHDTTGKWIPTKRVHVYAKEWNYLNPQYQAVY